MQHVWTELKSARQKRRLIFKHRDEFASSWELCHQLPSFLVIHSCHTGVPDLTNCRVSFQRAAVTFCRAEGRGAEAQTWMGGEKRNMTKLHDLDREPESVSAAQEQKRGHSQKRCLTWIPLHVCVSWCVETGLINPPALMLGTAGHEKSPTMNPHLPTCFTCCLAFTTYSLCGECTNIRLFASTFHTLLKKTRPPFIL